MLLNNKSASVWFLQVAEPLPSDDGTRLMRTGILAEMLTHEEIDVSWFTGRLNHSTKTVRSCDSPLVLKDNYRIYLLDGARYQKNISPYRVINQSQVALHFYQIAKSLSPPDVIVASYPSPEICLAGSYYAKMVGAKFIIDIRDPWPDILSGYVHPVINAMFFPLKMFYRYALRHAIKRADIVFAVSQSMLDWGQSLVPARKGDADKVIYLGYNDPGQFLEYSDNLCEFTLLAPLRVAFVGSFGHSYDAELIINAVRILQQKNERRIRLYLVGDGEFRPEWEIMAKDMDSVVFTGWLSRNQLKGLLSQCQVGVIPIRGGIKEYMLPNKLFEYLAYGLCVISNLPNDAKSLISEYKIGYTVNSDNGEDLAGCLERMISNRELVTSFQCNARKAFESKFSTNVVYSEYINAIKSMI
jgi:glycosyltransferase involved in cell wall biosynthesis